MTSKVRSYEADSLVVEYDVGRCIHAAECVGGLPAVFNPDARPWIDPSAAGADEVAEVVARCPTGALRYRRTDGGGGEAAPAVNVVRPVADGPLYLSGRLRLRMPDGSELEETRAALCRCGQSANKPFCDNRHRDAGFSDPGLIVEVKVREGDEGGDGVLDVRCAQNGPILLRGPFEVRGVDGARAAGTGGALCRCGQSTTRPFCDGTHRTAGFEAPGSD